MALFGGLGGAMDVLLQRLPATAGMHVGLVSFRHLGGAALAEAGACPSLRHVPRRTWGVCGGTWGHRWAGNSAWGAAGLALQRGEFAFLARASSTSQLFRPPRSSCCNAFAVVFLPSSSAVKHSTGLRLNMLHLLDMLPIQHLSDGRLHKAPAQPR